MPYINQFNINEDLVREVLRVKANLDITPNTNNLPSDIKTIQPKKQLGLTEWFNHIKNSLREQDKFGKLDIK